MMDLLVLEKERERGGAVVVAVVAVGNGGRG